ncbi:MAG TPA: hypothetical protein DDW42_07475 [Desulfobacteraceae bacterium]|nr:hypothetical protein [Desulfobacteraceae bacterium]
MPRLARLDGPSVLHHVIMRGIEHRRIFRDSKDHDDFLARFEDLIPRTKTSCYAWALLTNYAHFLLRTGDAQSGSDEGFARLINDLKIKKWVMYAKRPFAGPEKILDYLGRYTHRVAISNHRILSIDDGKVTFSYKDRNDDNKTKLMTLKANEFIRRFLLHVLPQRFVKIRYFGFMFHRERQINIELIRKLMDVVAGFTEKVNETIQQIML